MDSCTLSASLRAGSFARTQKSGHPPAGRREMTTDVLRVRRRRRRQATDSHLSARELWLVLGQLVDVVPCMDFAWSRMGRFLAALAAAVAGIQLWARGGTYGGTAPDAARPRSTRSRETRPLVGLARRWCLALCSVFALSVPRERYREWSAAAATLNPPIAIG